MLEITANEIKTKGISSLDIINDDGDDAVITVKGKKKYVVIPIEKYSKIRELELELAVKEVKDDIASGRFYSSVKKHLKKVANV
ncbi:MAG: type II toxin-antitoxin system Phd/YefM family antitoxin [Ignavibacteriae bacterium]|nr:type II toxin-antitoxin system Phd/YefM family antitoxin [Ignavibacteriota bacterium]